MCDGVASAWRSRSPELTAPPRAHAPPRERLGPRVGSRASPPWLTRRSLFPGTGRGERRPARVAAGTGQRLRRSERTACAQGVAGVGSWGRGSRLSLHRSLERAARALSCAVPGSSLALARSCTHMHTHARSILLCRRGHARVGSRDKVRGVTCGGEVSRCPWVSVGTQPVSSGSQHRGRVSNLT